MIETIKICFASFLFALYAIVRILNILLMEEVSILILGKKVAMDFNVTEMIGTYYRASIDGIQLLMNWKIAKHQCPL